MIDKWDASSLLKYHQIKRSMVLLKVDVEEIWEKEEELDEDHDNNLK